MKKIEKNIFLEMFVVFLTINCEVSIHFVPWPKFDLGSINLKKPKSIGLDAPIPQNFREMPKM